MGHILIRISLAIFTILACATPSWANAVEDSRRKKSLLVLVPGFWNSLGKGSVNSTGTYVPYFSATVLNTLQARAELITLKNLSPVGTIAENGDLLLQVLDRAVATHPGRRMVVVAHSAGGLYTMHALTKRPDLPIDTVVTIATPYRGIEFIETLADNAPVLRTLAQYISLDSLVELKTAEMPKVLAPYHVPDRTRWIALAGAQAPCYVINCWNPHRLSWILSIAQALMSSASDGVVTVSSALGRGFGLARSSGNATSVENWSDLKIDLEHWEIVQDAKMFRLLGVTNTGELDREQRRVFNEILTRLGY